MDTQSAFNIAITLAAFLGGFVLKAIWDGLKDLQQADKQLTDRVHEVEKLVAGEYVTRDELRNVVDALFRKLDKIESKLDSKQDKGQ